MLGDLEEAHRNRARSVTARLAARVLTAVETLDMAAALVRARVDRFRTNKGSSIVQDYKLGFRMLVKYPGLTLAGGLALAIAIGIGAGWYDLVGRSVPSDAAAPRRRPHRRGRDARLGDESRTSGDCCTTSSIWRRDVRSIEDLGAYRTLERNLMLGDARAGAGDRRGDDGVGVPASRACRRSWAGRCSTPTNNPARRRSSCSATTCGSGGSADARMPSDRRCNSEGRRRPSSASCRRASRFRSTTGCGCRCNSGRPGTRRSRARRSGCSAGWRRGRRRRRPTRRSRRSTERVGGGVATDARAPSSARPGVRRRVSRRPVLVRVRR